MPSLIDRIAARFGYLPTREATAFADQAYKAASIAAVTRLQASAQQQHRSLLAALTTPDVASWQTDGAHINVLTETGLATTRARARQAAHDNGYAKRYIGIVLRNVLGSRGMVYQSRVRTQAGSLKDPTNELLESAWTNWQPATACDLSGALNWRMLNRVALRQVIIDGEVFVRLHPGRGPHAFQVQLLPADVVPINHRADLAGGVTIRQGIECDREGRMLAIHIRAADIDLPLGLGSAQQSMQRLVRIPASEILHIKLPDQLGQLRGLPWLTTALKPMYQANDFAMAGLNKARESAKRGGFIEQNPDHIDPVDPNPTADPETETEAPTYQTLQDATWDVLPAGATAKPFQSDYPNIEFGQFLRDALRHVSSALDVPYMDLANDLSDVNYSSGQLGREDVKELWLELQQWWQESMAEPVHRRWLDHALLTAPELKSLSFARIPAYAAGATWQCHRWRPLDPSKTSAARKESLALQLTSPQRLLAEDGIDPDELLAEWQAWRQKLAAAGLQAAPIDQPSDPAQAQSDPVSES